MDILQTVTLALLQGLTEFLPISSSAHLILVPVLTGWADQGLAFDIAVHVGTLAAVLVYFRREIRRMAVEWFASLRGQGLTPDARLAWAVLLGTIPVGLAGILFKGYVEGVLRGPLVIATTTVVFALFLWWVDVRCRHARDEHTIGWRDVLVIGVAQAVALIPGVSRSGITMTAALMMGFTRAAAARYSFLLSIPVIVLAGGLETLDLLRAPQVVDWRALFVGAVLSGASAWLCIRLFLGFIERIGMLPFVIYRLLLGVALFLIFI